MSAVEVLALMAAREPLPPDARPKRRLVEVLDAQKRPLLIAPYTHVCGLMFTLLRKGWRWREVQS